MSSQNFGQGPPGYPPGAPPGAPPQSPPPAAPPAAAPPAQGYGQQGGYQMGPPPAGGPPGEPKQRNETMAIVSLAAGIVAILCIFPGCCCYLSFLAPLPGVAGIVLGIMARKKIEQDPVNLTGDKLALIGMICGGVATALFVVFLVLYILGFAGQVINDLPRNF